MSSTRRPLRDTAHAASDAGSALMTRSPRPYLAFETSAEVPLWKRGLDIVLITLLLPFVLPVMAAVALLVKLTSKGSVLFKQERVGLRGDTFVLFKFRTMIAGNNTAVHEDYVEKLIASDGPMTKLDNYGDTRLIPFGRLLRAAGLDELPQLINVLRGEMSLVGPRPCLPREFDRYLPAQRERFNTLPGLTGLWQVSGKNRLTFTEMVNCDIRYARTASLWLDLKIILKTLPVLIGEVLAARRSARAQRVEAVAPSHANENEPRRD